VTTMRLAMAALVVPDYQSGIDFYVGQLGFRLAEDVQLAPGKRWVVVDPGNGARLLLAQAADPAQRAAIGNQTGGRVGFFLETDDFAATHAAFLAKNVVFEETPRHESYGTVAVFRDPFGNRWDLIGPAERLS